jgi:hypothetical protein
MNAIPGRVVLGTIAQMLEDRCRKLRDKIDRGERNKLDRPAWRQELLRLTSQAERVRAMVASKTVPPEAAVVLFAWARGAVERGRLWKVAPPLDQAGGADLVTACESLCC